MTGSGVARPARKPLHLRFRKYLRRSFLIKNRRRRIFRSAAYLICFSLLISLSTQKIPVRSIAISAAKPCPFYRACALSVPIRFQAIPSFRNGENLKNVLQRLFHTFLKVAPFFGIQFSKRAPHISYPRITEQHVFICIDHPFLRIDRKGNGVFRIGRIRSDIVLHSCPPDKEIELFFCKISRQTS